MSGRISTERRGLKRISAITLIALTLLVAGAGGLMAYAAAGIDRVQAAKERELAQIRLDRTLNGLVENINSSAIWNDSILMLAAEPDLAWIQSNFGDYYADFMGHAVTLVYDRNGRMILASRDSEPVSADSERAFLEAVAPLVAEVRREAAARHDRPRVGFDAVVNRTAVVRSGNDIYLVGLGTIVPEDRTTARLDNDPVVVSAKPLSGFLTSLEKDLAFRDPTLVEADARRGSPGHLSLTGPDDIVLGQVEWAPARPGLSVLRDAAPMVALLILLLAAAAVALVLRVTHIVRRLEENELDLTEARDRAEAANVAKTRFLAIMSHELRTPLNGVLGMAQVLAVSELSARQRSQLGVLQQSGENLLGLIERILTVARIEKGELVAKPTAVDVAALLVALAAEHRSAAERAGLTLDVSVARDVTGVWCLDGEHLREALGHLVDNAIRHTARGSVRLEARLTGPGLEVRVVDTGVGIDPARLPDLFGKFVQADDSATRAQEGAGVGLTLARGLIEAMGGSVRAMSTPGLGSTFLIEVPAERVEPDDLTLRQAA